MKHIIWWARRDLRLVDNITLHYALQDADSVIPAFVLDPRLLNSHKLAPARKQFLFDSLANLHQQLVRRGSRLTVRRGEPARELGKLVKETQAEAVYFHRDYTPFARRRDERVVTALNALGVRVEAFDDNYLVAPEQVLKEDGTPYTVYSPFRLRLERTFILPSRFCTDSEFNTPPGVKSLEIPLYSLDRRWQRGGEDEGRALARAFMRRPDGLNAYQSARDLMALDATSHLSPHLHFGTVSVRELVRAAREMAEHQHGKAWIDELVWREFFAQVLWHFPHAAKGAYRRPYDGVAWENDPGKFEAWCNGLTGYPIVDAAMRQLNASGWMHNRARMIVASFLAKDLLVDWRWGEEYFMRRLIDGDMASNNGGWQWAAGTGTDAQPFFRIFNPILQGKRFDVNGEYVKRWVPELTRVPSSYIHAPWSMPEAVGRGAGVRVGRDYPLPMVDHRVQRERALALYRSK